MTVDETFIEGLKVLTPKLIEDSRGSFFKTFHEVDFKRIGLPTEWKEEYFSVSQKDVIRGMHFQIPPYDHQKMVSCMQGGILDVVVDLRKESRTYQQVFSKELNAINKTVLIIPKGCAHGFLSLENFSMMHYKVSTVYSPEHDKGILWNSIGFNWPIHVARLSERDKKHPSIDDFKSPF